MSPFTFTATRATSQNPHLTSRPNVKEKYQEKDGSRIQSKELEKRKFAMNHNSTKEKGALSGAHADSAVNDVQATAVPDPIPADSFSTDTTMRTTLTVTPTFSIASTSFASASLVSASLGSSPNARSTTTVWIPAPKLTITHTELSEASESAHLPSTGISNRLPVYGIILLAGVGVGIAIAALLVIRCFLRRRTHIDRPRPSNPILQESPLFGGKERFSRGIWSDSSFNNLLTSHAKAEKGDGWRPLSGDRETISEKVQNKRQSVSVTQNLAPNNSMSAQLSPSSVYTTAVPSTAVGVALDFPIPPQTVHSATQPLKVKEKGTEGKTARRRSVNTSIYGGTEFASPALTDTETAIAYQAPRPAPTPGRPKPALKSPGFSRDDSHRPSRKNTPSPASRGSLYRSPSASRAARQREKEEPFLYVLPIVKSQERRDRDTKALTSALGLASPPPPSSCFSPISIYPDDSISVAHGYPRPPSEAPPSEMPSPSGVHAALGDLMLQGFPSIVTPNSLRAGDPFVGGQGGKKGGKGRVNDRPPRVPSPPPLPSLSQMALASADPDYHSPTYSIYGLYEAQRKSKRSSVHN